MTTPQQIEMLDGVTIPSDGAPPDDIAAIVIDPTEPEPELTDDAPWGRKADGTPRKKPGRRGADDMGATYDRLNSVGSPPPRRPAPPPSESLPEPEPAIAPDYDQIGKIAAGVFFATGEAAFGADWSPDTANKEHLQIANAFSKYFESQQLSDISPGWALVLTLGSYTIKRFHKPTIRERVSAGVTWLKSKFHRG